MFAFAWSGESARKSVPADDAETGDAGGHPDQGIAVRNSCERWAGHIPPCAFSDLARARPMRGGAPALGQCHTVAIDFAMV